MKKVIFHKLFFVFVLFYSTKVFPQTIINYQTWTGASGCNIFASSVNVPASINGNPGSIAHLTAIGQPEYDQNAVSLGASIFNSGNTPVGTEYRITYNFQQGASYKYYIEVSDGINKARLPLSIQR